jgi:hypothetical protein
MSGINQDAANRANPNSLADLFRKLGLGDLLRGQMNQVQRHLDPAAPNAYGIASTEQVVLPNTGKANTIIRAVSRAGTSLGALTIDGYTATAPSAGHIGISPNGDLMFAPSADTTDVDVTYVAERGDVVELFLPVASDALVIPASLTARGVVYLLEAESLAGGLVAKMHVLLPSDSKPATTKANVNVAHSQVLFAVADAVTRARVLLLVATAQDLNTVLSATDDLI